MRRHDAELPTLVKYLNPTKRLEALLVHGFDGIFSSHGVADVDGLEESQPIVTVGKARDLGFSLDLDHRRSGGSKCKGQNSMHNALLVGRRLHELFIDVHLAEVTGDTCEHINIRFTYRFGERYRVTDL